MGFTVPNLASASFQGQACPDSTDLAILAAGIDNTGVISGCGVTAQGTPNMTVAVASGSILATATTVAVSAVSALTIGAASATDRRDLVVVSAAGVVSVVAGTAATGSAVPVKPALPAGSAALAEVYVSASTTAVASANIIDKRALVVPDRFIYNVRDYGAVGDGVADDAAAIDAAKAAAVAAGGGIVFFPAGTYRRTTALTYVSNVLFVGVGRASVLQMAASVNLNPFISAQGVSFSGIYKLTVDYNHQNNATSTTGMQIGLSGGSSCSHVDTVDCVFLNAKGFAIGYSGGPLAQNDHCNIVGNRVLNPLATPNDMVLVVVNYGLVSRNRVIGPTANMAMSIYECTETEVWGNEIELGAASTGSGLTLMSCTRANAHDNTVVGPDTSHGTAYVIATEHDNASPVSSERNRLHDNIAYQVGTGIQLLETNYDEVKSNRIDNAATGFQFPTGTQASWQTIADNFLINVTTAVSNTGGGAFSQNNLWRGNRSVASPVINPAGRQGPPAVSATTVALTNPYPYDCTVYVAGGTVTAIAIGGNATGLTAGSFRVPYGQTITLTYTVAPTWQWFAD